MSQRSRGRDVLARVWLPLVAVIAVAAGALCMWKVHQASAPGPVLAVNGPQAPEEFVPKQLTYELDGDLGDGGLLSYIDIDGHPHTVDLDDVALVAHRDDHAHRRVRQHLGTGPRRSRSHCRMLVNGVVRDDQSATRQNADVTCRVKSA